MTPRGILKSLLLLSLSLLPTRIAQAASIVECGKANGMCVATDVGRSLGRVKEKHLTVGDYVKILDEMARPVAVGRITRVFKTKDLRQGAVILILDRKKRISRGYPVLLDSRSREQMLWSTSFSNFDT